MKTNTKTRKTIRDITISAMIAAVYIAVTSAVAPFGFEAIQFRVSEALTVLPFIFPQSIMGIFIGCLISNLLSPFGALDIILGSLASLIAAIWTSRMKSKYLAPLPPVVVNAVVVGFLIAFSASGNSFSGFNMAIFYTNVATVGLSQAVVCYGLGLPLITVMQKLFSKLKREI